MRHGPGWQKRSGAVILITRSSKGKQWMGLSACRTHSLISRPPRIVLSDYLEPEVAKCYLQLAATIKWRGHCNGMR